MLTEMGYTIKADFQKYLTLSTDSGYSQLTKSKNILLVFPLRHELFRDVL